MDIIYPSPTPFLSSAPSRSLSLPPSLFLLLLLPPRSLLHPLYSLYSLYSLYEGCAYLANVHFRRVKSLAPEYPQIDSLLEYLDGYELHHAQLMKTVSLEVEVFIFIFIHYEADGVWWLNSTTASLPITAVGGTIMSRL